MLLIYILLFLTLYGMICSFLSFSIKYSYFSFTDNLNSRAKLMNHKSNNLNFDNENDIANTNNYKIMDIIRINNNFCTSKEKTNLTHNDDTSNKKISIA